MSDVLVCGLGNSLRGDDGAGLAVLDALVESEFLPPDLALYNGSRSGLLTTLVTERYERVFVIDAVEMQQQPGAWQRFDLDAAVFSPGDMRANLSLHHASLPETLAIAQALGVTLPQITLYGIQPQSVELAQGLSAPVAEAVRAVTQALLTAIHTKVETEYSVKLFSNLTTDTQNPQRRT